MRSIRLVLAILVLLTPHPIFSQDSQQYSYEESPAERLNRLSQPEIITGKEAEEAYYYTSRGYTYMRGRNNKAVMEAAISARNERIMSTILTVLKYVIGIPLVILLFLIATGIKPPRNEGRYY